MPSYVTDQPAPSVPQIEPRIKAEMNPHIDAGTAGQIKTETKPALKTPCRCGSDI